MLCYHTQHDQGGEEEEVDIYGSVESVQVPTATASSTIAAPPVSTPTSSSAFLEINEYAKYTSAAATATAAYALEKKNDGLGYGFHGPGQRGVYVGEFDWWVSDQTLSELFSQFGRVIDVKIFTEKLNGKEEDDTGGDEEGVGTQRWLHYTLLYSTILYYTILLYYYTILYYTSLQYTILHHR
jgi:hypothetical protein